MAGVEARPLLVLEFPGFDGSFRSLAASPSDVINAFLRLSNHWVSYKCVFLIREREREWDRPREGEREIGRKRERAWNETEMKEIDEIPTVKAFKRWEFRWNKNKANTSHQFGFTKKPTRKLIAERKVDEKLMPKRIKAEKTTTTERTKICFLLIFFEHQHHSRLLWDDTACPAGWHLNFPLLFPFTLPNERRRKSTSIVLPSVIGSLNGSVPNANSILDSDTTARLFSTDRWTSK